MSSIWSPTVGARVRLQGLQARKDLNGRTGRVSHALDETTGKVGVHVFADFSPSLQSVGVQIKPGNLVEDPATFLDGFHVVESGDEGLGRIAVATQDYAVGDTVLVEPPFLVFDPQSGYPGMMDAYLNSDAASRKDMMDMYCPPLPEEETEAEQKTNGDIDAVLQRKQEETLERLDWLEFDWNQYACQEPSIKTSMPLETARRVMRIIDANAHNYAIQTTGGIVDTPQNDQSALFALGSKVEHSCAPNLNYATEHGKLQYTAIRPIANGERISISYDTPKFSHPRKQRREFLQMSKEFTCRCRRCRGPDECSPYQFSCPTCSSSSIAFSNESGDEYFCISCQFTLPSSNSGIREQKELENSLSQQLETEQSNMQAGVFDKKMISRMVALLNTMTQQLHPLHWLLPQGCDLMSSMATSVARLDMKGGQSPTSPMVRTLLYLSTISWLNQACWWQRMGAVAYQDMELKDAVRDSKTPAPLLLTENPTLHTVETMAKQVCENLSTSSFVNMAHPIYHAGQDWLLAGHAPQVARLYQAFMPIFQQWNKLGDETRDNIAVLVQTEGATNEFPNHLLLS